LWEVQILQRQTERGRGRKERKVGRVEKRTKGESKKADRKEKTDKENMRLEEE
jgi:hypothetical protein